MYGRALASPASWGVLRRALGAFLALSLVCGTVTVADAWAATFYVNVATGDDINNDAVEAQNPATPWQSITRALTEATLAPGDVIEVAAGTYDDGAPGVEIFPLELVDGVTLRGADPATTIIEGDGTSDLIEADGIDLASTTVLENFTLRFDADSSYALLYFNVEDTVQAPTVRNNTFSGRYSGGGGTYGVYLEVSTSTTAVFTGLFENNRFDDLYYGAYLYDYYGYEGSNVSPTFRGNDFTENYYGIYGSGNYYMGGTFAPLIEGNEFSGGSSADVYMYFYPGYSFEATVAPTIRQNTFSNGYWAVALYSYQYSDYENIALQPTISGNTMTNMDYGVYGSFSVYSVFDGAHADRDVTIANNTFTNTSYQAVYLTDSVYYMYSSENGSLDSNVSITGNTIDGAGSTAIYYTFELSDYDVFENYTLDQAATIANNSLANLDYYGIYVTYDFYSAQDTWDFAANATITGNTVAGNASYEGIYFYSSYGGSLNTLNVLVAGNSVTGVTSSEGIEVSLYSMSDVANLDVQIRDNYASNNEYGIYSVVYFGHPTSAPLLSCNTATGNNYSGLSVYSYSIDTPADLGGGAQGSPGLNSAFGNDDYDLYTDVDATDAATLFAESNWWGTTSGIDALIRDDEEDGANAAVDFDPFLSAAPGLAGGVPLDDSLLVDADASGGPSIGDTILYTATISTTGSCGCAAGTFTAPIPANADVVPGSVATTDGNVTDEDPVTVVIGHLEANDTVTITWEVVPTSGTEMSTQGTFTCVQLGDVVSDDPATGPAQDPTVTPLAGGFVPPSLVEIPTLGQWGLAIFMALLGLLGVALLRRRRTSAALLLALGLGLAASAASAATAAAPSREAGGPAKAQRPAPARELVVTMATSGETTTLTLADGRQVTAPSRRIAVREPRPERQPREARSAADRPRPQGPRGPRAAATAAVPSGGAGIATIHRRPDGSIDRIALHLFASRQEAEQRLAAQAAPRTGRHPKN